ncbi:MAG: sporulation protein YunB [Clostridium sp.]|nr:sporulation protein YunB [Clostridium sp.]MDU7082387.1 sporulation protein YunB [Clostridium sp.]
MKLSIKIKFAVIVILLMGGIVTFVYTLDDVIMPRVMVTCDATMRAKVTELMNKTILDEYSKKFNYDEIMVTEKDSEGNITMMTADTLKLNEIATSTVLKAQAALEKIDKVDVKVPIGHITKNNLLANYGPKVTVKVHPIGSITTKYISQFDSAGINQTRHTIYVEATTKVKLILPFQSSELEVVNQIPIVETIIVGKVPNTAIQLNR